MNLLNAMLCVAVAASPSPSPSPSPSAAPPAPPKGEGALTIVAWPGYIERGESDRRYDWVTGFEKETGCKVTVKTANTSDEMIALMNTAGNDLVTASGDASLRLVATQKVQPLDMARLPNYSTVDPRLQNAAWHSAKEKHYGVPFQWGPNVLMYNTRVFKTPPKSWSVLFTAQDLPDGKPNLGRVQAYDGAIAVADAALYLMALKPELKIRDPYELTPFQYQEVIAVLKEQRRLVQAYWHDTTAQVEAFKAGKFVVASAWGYQVNALKGEGQPVESTVPDEGCTGWADTTMLAAHAPHPNCAYLWLEHSLDKSLQSSLAEWFGSLPSVPTACTQRAPNGTDFCKTNGFDRFEKIQFWKTPTLECRTQASCVPYRKWAEDYAAIKASK